MGALVEITSVDLSDPLPGELRDGFLDAPRAGAVLDAGTVDVLGWALGAERSAVAVELCFGEVPFWRAPLQLDRPDVAEAFPECADAARAGFATSLDLIGKQEELTVGVSVVLEDDGRARLATVHGRRRWRHDRSPELARLVSVVIACAGDGRGSGAAIESALAQTYPHLEVLVIGDGSSEEAGAIAARHPGVKWLGTGGLGPAQARNLGIRSSNGDYLVFLDSDVGSGLPPTAVETGVRALEERPACAAASDSTVMPAWALYRRSLFEHLRGFDPSLGAAGEADFIRAVARRFAVCQLDADPRLSVGG